MWYEEVNKKGGIHGRKIKVIVEDDKCSPADVVAVVKKFITVDNAFLVHGGSCTAPTVAAQETVTREKVPLVMLNAAGDGATIMEFGINGLKGKKIAYLAHDDDFGNANWSTAKGVADRLGAEVVVVERMSPRITDVTAPLLKVRAANPDVIISTAYPAPTVLIAQKYAEFGMTKTPLVIAVQGIPVPSAFYKNVDNEAAFANIYYGSPLNDLTDGPKQQKWIAMYKQYYPDRQMGAFMAYGLPSAMAITRALEAVGKNLTREAFVDAMEKVNFDSEVLAGPTAFGPNQRDGMRSSVFIKFDGKTHTLMPGFYHWNGKDGM